MAASLFKSRLVHEIAGRTLAGYLKLVRALSRIRFEPPGAQELVRAEHPLIFAMWHGQHLMIPFARPDWMKACSLASRHADGEVNAIALRQLGIGAIRGSGAIGKKVREKGGAGAFLAMVKRLAAGETMVLTADVPKRARVCGEGIIQLAKVSGRPIRPVAVVTRWRVTLGNWDRTTFGLPLPFNRCAIVVGEPIRVEREADAATSEAARLALQAGLDEVHRKAYAMLDAADPGRNLRAAAASPETGGAA